MPTDRATEFENELEVFRREAESAVQFFYAWRTVNEVASKDKRVVEETTRKFQCQRMAR